MARHPAKINAEYYVRKNMGTTENKVDLEHPLYRFKS